MLGLLIWNLYFANFEVDFFSVVPSGLFRQFKTITFTGLLVPKSRGYLTNVNIHNKAPTPPRYSSTVLLHGTPPWYPSMVVLVESAPPSLRNFCWIYLFSRNSPMTPNFANIAKQYFKWIESTHSWHIFTTTIQDGGLKFEITWSIKYKQKLSTTNESAGLPWKTGFEIIHINLIWFSHKKHILSTCTNIVKFQLLYKHKLSRV